MTDELPLRTATADDHSALAELFASAFLHDPEPEVTQRHRMVYEPERTHVIEDAGAQVGTAAIFTRDMTVPGAVVPAAHVTGVAVAATHRRRGLLTQLMHAQLNAISNRGTEPIAALWASEGGIYGRFGYGIAARHLELTLNRGVVQVPGRPAAGLRQAKPADVAEDMAAVFERVRADRPGWSSRPNKWWDWLLTDVPSRRDGMSSLRAVVFREGDRATGYALWRVKLGWENDGPAGTVKVVQVVTQTSAAYAGVWRFLLSIDLTRKVSYLFGALDEPLPFVVSDPHNVVTSVAPSLWVRIVDAAAALSARRYAAPIDVVLDVGDDVRGDNACSWHLVGDGAAASCVRTSADADIRLDVRDLGAIYLGGTSLQALADAGRVTEHMPGAVAEATIAFGWHRAPSAIEIF